MTEGAAFICEAIEAMAQGKFYEKFSITHDGSWERKVEPDNNHVSTELEDAE